MGPIGGRRTRCRTRPWTEASSDWNVGRTILEQQATETWGSKVLDRLARDLRAEFPIMKGFSRTNPYNMRAFAAAWDGPEPIVQTPSGRISWSHSCSKL